MSMYRYGHKIELKAKDELLKQGASIVIRSARSLTPIDLIAIFPEKHEILLVQCKAKQQTPKNKKTLQRKFKELKALEGIYTCKPVVYMKQDNRYTFIEV